jgi:uncharacterized protein
MDNIAHFRFYADLNHFLPRHKRKTQINHSFSGTPSIKDAIEAIGVPHTEIDLIIVNGESVGFDYHPKNGDAISVYPMFGSLDISPLIRLRPAPLPSPTFLCDVHLGALARLLRLVGFDTFYRNNLTGRQIVDIALAEKRYILTRDRSMLKRKAVTHGYCLRSIHPEEQIREVACRFHLHSSMKPFTLCLGCGGPVSRVDKASVAVALPDKTRECFDEFYKCGLCGKIYWQGGHFNGLQKKVEALTQEGCA